MEVYLEGFRRKKWFCMVSDYEPQSLTRMATPAAELPGTRQTIGT